jgi:hypothetical protein
MAESENNQGEVRRVARITGAPVGSICDGLTYTQAAEKVVREELSRTLGKRSHERGKTLMGLSGESFNVMVQVQDYFDEFYRDPSGPPYIVKVTVSLKFEFSARQPGANE